MTGRLRRVVSWCTLVISIGWAIDLFAANPDELGLMLSLHPVALGLLLALQFVFLVLHAQRYRIILEKCSRTSVAFYPWFRLFVLGRFFNAVLPQLGSAYRGYRLKELFGITWTRYLAAFFAFSWMSTAFNLFFALVVIAAMDPELELWGVPGTAILLGALALAAFGPFVALAMLRAKSWQTNRLVWLQARIQEALSIVLGNLRDGGHVAANLVLALAATVHGCLTIALVFRALGLSTSLSEILVFYTVLHLSSVIMVTPGNLGVRELLFGVLGGTMGTGMAESLLAAALLRFSDYAVMTIVATAVGGGRALRQISQSRTRLH